MVANVPLFLAFSAVIANLVQDISGLMCYECNSQYHSGCDTIRKEDKFNIFYQHCNPFTPFENVTEYRKPLCRKIMQRIHTRGSLRVTKRSCGYVLHKNLEEDICYDSRYSDHDEVVCQCFEDGCNLARSSFENFSLLCATITSFSTFLLNFS